MRAACAKPVEKVGNGIRLSHEEGGTSVTCMMSSAFGSGNGRAAAAHTCATIVKAEGVAIASAPAREHSAARHKYPACPTRLTVGETGRSARQLGDYMPDTPAAVITALIAERPLCLDCIAKEVALSLTATETALNVIQRALAVHRGEAPCRACGA